MAKQTYQRRKEYLTVYRFRLRKAVLALLGDKCVICGFDDWRALQVDYINGGGYQDKVKTTQSYFKAVLRSVENEENKFQLLCANCNWIKRYNKGEVRKK